MDRWHLITGEYPPQPGGVSDYTRLVAHGLAALGSEVHVWAPAITSNGRRGNASCQAPDHPGVLLHRLPGRFGLRALAELDAALAVERRPFNLLVQYVPHMYGWKAMNLLFCYWLLRRRDLRPRVMFHEVAAGLSRSLPATHNFLGVVNRLMAACVARAAAEIFVSVPAWGRLVRRLAPRHAAVTWLPVPSNVATTADPAEVAAVREKLACEAGTLVVGHFGTFGQPVRDLLAKVLPPVLAVDHRRIALLVGRDSKAFAEHLGREHPFLASRLIATGELAAGAVAAHLRACDLLVQPYPDGASSRRSSLMAGLALGMPIVTNHGPATEPLWQDGIVALVRGEDPAGWVAAAQGLETAPDLRRRLGEAGKKAYATYFSIDCTLRLLAAPSPATT